MLNLLIQPKAELQKVLDENTDFVEDYLHHKFIPKDQRDQVIAELGVEEIERREREWRRFHPDGIFSPIVWNVDIDLAARMPADIPGTVMRTKLLFLARISYSFKHGSKNFRRQVHALFSDPPEFSVANFDMWWEIQFIPMNRRYFDAFFMTEVKDYDSLHASDKESENQLLILRMMREGYDKLSEEKKKEYREGIFRQGFFT